MGDDPFEAANTGVFLNLTINQHINIKRNRIFTEHFYQAMYQLERSIVANKVSKVSI
jgi:hypothetical protein